MLKIKGLVRIVPPLIEADRNRRWDEIGERDGDPEKEMIDIYVRESLKAHRSDQLAVVLDFIQRGNEIVHQMTR